jgi:hypothetical protein
VGKRLSRDGKHDDSKAPTFVVLCNLRIVSEYFCSSGDVHPSVITVDILMCLMFEKRTAPKVQRSWWEHSPSFSRRRRPFGATSTTEDVLSGVNLRGKQILVPGVSAGLGVERARTRRTWRTCCRRGTGFQESRSGNRAGVAVVRICRGALCNKVFKHEGEKVQWRN